MSSPFRRRPAWGWAAVLLSAWGLMGCQGRSAEAPPAPAPEVAVVAVQPQTVTLTTELPGRTAAFRVAEIRPQVSGLLLKRRFTEGADVRAGEVLYDIDPAPFQAALRQAEASLARALANLPALRSRVARYRELLADQAVSQQDRDDAEAALEQAAAEVQTWQAAVETARINLAYTRITAPVAGRIGRSEVTEGAIVTAYQPLALATIQQLDPIYVDVPQSTTELLRLQQRLEDGRLDRNGRNQKAVRLILEDGAAYPLEGVLQFRDVTVDPTTGSVILRAVFPNPQGFLLPGMFVRAVMMEGVVDRAILIPQQAVSRDPKGNPAALVVGEGEKVESRRLTLDRALGDQWLVTAGLAPGERVVVEGLQKVRPGTVVKAVVQAAGPPAAPPPAAPAG